MPRPWMNISPISTIKVNQSLWSLLVHVPALWHEQVATVVSTCCFWMPYAFSDKCLPIPDIALDPINPVTGVRAVDL